MWLKVLKYGGNHSLLANNIWGYIPAKTEQTCPSTLTLDWDKSRYDTLNIVVKAWSGFGFCSKWRNISKYKYKCK